MSARRVLTIGVAMGVVLTLGGCAIGLESPNPVLMRAAEIYAERFADPDGRVRATFDLISLSGWAPAESQQRPLRPGSARVRLADVLKTTERSAGEKTGR